MARTISKYFNSYPGNVNEQRLVEDLIIESIRLRGTLIYYVPRIFVTEDPVFGEDPLSKFEKTFQIEAYFDNPEQGFGGSDRYLISKFGLEIRDTCSFIVSRRRFNEEVKYDGYNPMPNTTYTANEVRPLEGDLIFLPATNGLFIINFAEHESVFHQLGKLYVWRIDVQKFDYSAELINTGVPAIDRVQTVFDNVDSTTNDPLANNTILRTDAETIISTEEKDIFGDPI